MSRKNHKKRPKLVFKTPGRECQHADRGMCPRCLNPLTPRKYRMFRILDQ